MLNNPLAYTDPSGYFSFKKLFRAALAIAVAVFAPQISAYIGWTGNAMIASIPATGGLSGALGLSGAVASGALGGALAGGIMTGTTKGALIGGLTGGAFGGVGDIAPSGVGNVAGHALVGCASASASGGSCGAGALSAGAGSMWSNYGVKFESFSANLVTHAVVGGTASVLGGGKFDNGAVTGSFGYLFNYCAHNGCFDRRFDWNDAVDQWRNGNGSTVTDVKASELNLRDASFARNPDGSYQIHTSIKFDTGAIYGTVTGVLNVDGTMSIRPDTYNFDLKNPFKAGTSQEFVRVLLRDGLTLVGAGINGVGKPYRIEFSGSIPAPRDLPK